MSGSRAVLLRALAFWVFFQSLIFLARLVWIPVPMWAVGVITGTVIAGITLVATRWFLRREQWTFDDVGMAHRRGSFIRFAGSIPLGMAFYGVFILAYLAWTPLIIERVAAPDWLEATLLAVLALTALSAMEEIAFRGYLMYALERVIGIRGAIYLSSLLFGLYHGPTIESLTGPALWGLIYAVLAYWTRGLAVPIGFHAGANLIQSLLGQKQWASGIWIADAGNATTVLTIEQVTFGSHIALGLLGLVAVEYYVRRIHPKRTNTSNAD